MLDGVDTKDGDSKDVYTKDIHAQDHVLWSGRLLDGMSRDVLAS